MPSTTALNLPRASKTPQTRPQLRTPLHGIIGLSESLCTGRAGGVLPERAVQTIKLVMLSGKRLLQLINDILDAAKMKQGTLVIKHEKVDLRNLVCDVLDLSAPLVQRGVKLVNAVGRGVPRITGDSGRIVQVLYNLVGNAGARVWYGFPTCSAVGLP